MTDVTLIGLGAMGSALGEALIAQNYSLTVWNRSSGKAASLQQAGAVVAATLDEAVSASSVVITCITSHVQTLELLRNLDGTVQGKTCIELSTGTAEEAVQLSIEFEKHGAKWLIGIIHGYPDGVGQTDKVLTMAGDPKVWSACEPIVKSLGGKSCHIGSKPDTLAALFAGLFTVRTGFMFGMIYGAIVSKKAGIPLTTFVEQIPVSMGVLPSYYQSFADTVGTGDFTNPPASMATYSAALDDALHTFESLGAADQLPRLMSELAHRGKDMGHSDKALTLLVELLEK